MSRGVRGSSVEGFPIKVVQGLKREVGVCGPTSLDAGLRLLSFFFTSGVELRVLRVWGALGVILGLGYRVGLQVQRSGL